VQGHEENLSPPFDVLSLEEVMKGYSAQEAQLRTSIVALRERLKRFEHVMSSAFVYRKNI